MKTTKFLPSPPSPFGGALNMRNIYLSILCLIIATLWNTHSVASAPAKTDLQPPIFEASASASSPSSSQANGKSDGTTIDSYGNPIESLQPIETPDGRKVVSAQGLQFEIPNYASGITELKKPADDLLPPFVAPFEPTTTAATSSLTTSATTTALGADAKKVPLSADRESFPPFNNIITGSSTLPSKTTFTKSEDGKVITNNIFLSGSIGSTSVKPFGSSFGLSNQEKNTFSTQSFTGSSFTKSTTASSVFKQFGSTSSGVTGFVTTADSSNDGSKYTGRFGGPPGVLAPQNSGFTTSSTTVTKTYNKPAFTTFGITSSPGFVTTNNKDKFTGSFGGPPGILKPYDNVKNR